MTIRRSETSFSRVTAGFSMSALPEIGNEAYHLRAMGEAGAVLQIETSAVGARRARAHGRWTFQGIVETRRELADKLAQIERAPANSLDWDLTQISDLDDAGAVWLARALRHASPSKS